MTVRLDLTPEVQAALLSQARANGMSLESFAEQVLREKSFGLPSGEANQPRPAVALSPEQRLREFNAFISSHAGNMVVLPHEDMERESIYGDHGR